ncbi:MAG: flagellar biosynthesis anti-sigma factor FlgM [Spirochaetales bacterium]|nr:flagellar biosynthesis anti-sigma factor FlgM [Spirochaetales bacterium]
MVIDKIGGIGPSYEPRKADAARDTSGSRAGQDNIVISAEASRAQEVARISRAARETEETGRADRLKEVKAKLSSGAYDNLSDEVLSTVADRVTESFLG